MSGKKGEPTKFLAHLRIMVVEFSQRARRESGLVDSSQRLLVQSIQRLRPKAEILTTATKFAQSSRKVAAYNTVQEALTRIRDAASQLTQSKLPPPELVDALRVVCVVGDLLSISSFATFKSSFLRDLFGQPAVADLSDRTKISESLKFGLLDETFSEQQILDAVKPLVQQFMGGDMTNFEKIFGQTPPPTQPPSGGVSSQSQAPAVPPEQPQSKPPFLGKARAPTHQQMPPLCGQSTVLQRQQQPPPEDPVPPSLGQSMALQRHQQAPSYPQLPPEQAALSQAPSYPQVPFGDLGGVPTGQGPSHPQSQGQRAQQPPPAPSGQPRLQYTKMGFVFPLINVPVFPREIWGQMVDELRAAIS